jgi:hypothetical protein
MKPTVFIIDYEIFKYHEGNLYVSVDGAWHKDSPHASRELAEQEAQAIVDEYNAMGLGKDYHGYL